MRDSLAGAVFAGALLAGCGRVAFEDTARDARTDSAMVDAAVDAPVAREVAMASIEAIGTSASLSITPLSAGNLLVVAVLSWDSNFSVAGVSAGGALAPATVQAIQGNVWSHLWYGRPAAATSMVTVTLSGASAGFDIFAAEFEHVAAGPPAQSATDCRLYPPDLAVAQVSTTVAGELVFGATMFEAPIYVDNVGAPFNALPYRTGNGAAYAITTMPGDYGPLFQISAGAGMNAMTCAATVSFMPGP